MQEITRSEADYLREKLPSAYIVVTSKHKKGRAKRYAVEETSVVKRCLQEYHDLVTLETYR